jgi:hypothetical protein
LREVGTRFEPFEPVVTDDQKPLACAAEHPSSVLRCSTGHHCDHSEPALKGTQRFGGAGNWSRGARYGDDRRQRAVEVSDQPGGTGRQRLSGNRQGAIGLVPVAGC